MKAFYCLAIALLFASNAYAQTDVDLAITRQMIAENNQLNQINFSRQARGQIVAIEQQKADALTSVARTYSDNPTSNPPLFGPLTVDEQKVYANPFLEIPAARPIAGHN